MPVSKKRIKSGEGGEAADGGYLVTNGDENYSVG